MNADLQVTVLIDTYNSGHLIHRAIESVLAQTYPASSMELLIVDDGSTDDTAEVVQRYANRVRYIVKQNGGQASAVGAYLPIILEQFGRTFIRWATAPCCVGCDSLG